MDCDPGRLVPGSKICFYFLMCMVFVHVCMCVHVQYTCVCEDAHVCMGMDVCSSGVYALVQHVFVFMWGIHVFLGTNKRTPYLPGQNEYTSLQEEHEDWTLMQRNVGQNLLGQDFLGQMDVVITTDHLAFYADKTEQSVIR